MAITLTPEVRDLLTLRLVPGIGPRLTAALLHRFGSAAAVLRARPSELQEVPHIGARLAEQLAAALQKSDVDAELALMELNDVHLLIRGTAGYPSSLENITDPPHLLYIRGTLEARDANAIAIVGSRSCTGYGRRMADRLAAELVRAGFTVISGLARGIDGVAHRAALQAGGRTLAVLAGGLSSIYPPEHRELADQVAAGGALLTESAMRMEPMAGMFPARNRLISGLARGVVIIEAAERSGALITASHAGDQGRPVFAVPGPMDSPASAGTHQLLRKGAILIRGTEDILEEINGVAPARGRSTSTPEPSKPLPELDDVQRRIWDYLGERPRHVDEMAQHFQTPVGPLSSTLLLMEMKKVVRRLPGNLYERT
jgi:DNA processing protein